MAQWSRVDRTLVAKVVYYGPALGGKTTNLRALHRITDPESRQRLVSLNTADDRTLFFDLLPIEIGTILGYRVALKVFTVPGQVRYDATRRVVLAGADAVVFVADSAQGREAENRQSWDNLRMNLLANRLDPASIPILLQFNKRDLPDAAPEARMRAWFGDAGGLVVPAVARRGEGVLESFSAACKAMLDRLASLAGPDARRRFEAGELGRQLDRALAPFHARVAAEMSAAAEIGAPTDEPIVSEGRDLLENAVLSGVRLGGELAVERAAAVRHEREADALRRLGDMLRSTAATFDRAAIVDDALRAGVDVLGAAVLSLVRLGSDGSVRVERCWGSSEDPLLTTADGRDLVRRIVSSNAPCVIEDLGAELAASEVAALAGIGAFAAIPVDADRGRAILAYHRGPEREFAEHDIRFLATLAGHLAVGLEKARAHRALELHRDRLEREVAARTRDLRLAYDELRRLDRTKDRFLAGVSHEMRTPLTGILSAAVFLRDYDGSAAERRELAGGIVRAAEALERQLGSLLRVAELSDGDGPLRARRGTAAEIVEEGIRLAGIPPEAVRVELDPRLPALSADVDRLARAVANLLDNASKFSPPGAPIVVLVAPCRLVVRRRAVDAVSFAVLDRGPGIPDGDVERMFAPFEQGGDGMTDKPAGAGLGLHEARAVARRHGGDVRYEARPDGGSALRLVVPLVADDPAEVPEARVG